MAKATGLPQENEKEFQLNGPEPVITYPLLRVRLASLVSQRVKSGSGVSRLRARSCRRLNDDGQECAQRSQSRREPGGRRQRSATAQFRNLSSLAWLRSDDHEQRQPTGSLWKRPFAAFSSTGPAASLPSGCIQRRPSVAADPEPTSADQISSPRSRRSDPHTGTRCGPRTRGHTSAGDTKGD